MSIRQIAAALNLLHNEPLRAFLSDQEVQALEIEDEKKLSFFDPRRLLEVLHPTQVQQRIEQLPAKAFFEQIYKEALPEKIKIVFLNKIFTNPEDRAIPEKPQAARLSFLLGKPLEYYENLFVCIGCHSLAASLRQVISKKQIDQVLSALQPLCKRYLRNLLFSPKRFSVEPLSVKVATCTPDELRTTLKNKGLKVFQKLLQQQESEFRWYFFRQGDVALCNLVKTDEVKSDEKLPLPNAEKWVDAICDIERYISHASV